MGFLSEKSRTVDQILSAGCKELEKGGVPVGNLMKFQD